MVGLNSQLQKIKKEGITISEYLARIKEVFDKYSAMGEPLSYRDKLMYTLNGLTEEYDGFVTSIYNRSDKSSLKEVHSLLYTYAYWLEQRNTAQQLQFSQVNLTAYSGQNKFHKNQQPNFPKYPQNSYSSFPNKPINLYQSFRPNSQPSILGKPQGQPQSSSKWFQKQGTGNFGPRPQCQICGKFGHMALNCYHRANLNYQPQFPNSQPKPQPPNPIAAMLTTSTSPTMPFNNCDTPWYMDSGATHHFTPEFGNLTDPCVLTGDEQAMVGNGKSIRISHIGNAMISSL